MYSQISGLHENVRYEHAKRLSLSLEEFDRLVESSHRAYAIFKDLGPFYGREDIKEPTFRITAEPVTLPREAKKTLIVLGQDLLVLGKVLSLLPEAIKIQLGEHLDFHLPPTFRIDAILTVDGTLKINEIEGQDGASALMMAEQYAYNLQDFSESTASKLIPTLKSMCSKKNLPIKIAFIRANVATNPCSPNAERFIQFIHYLSKGDVKLEHLNDETIRDGSLKPDWSAYDGVINETSFCPEELFSIGVKPEQLLATGNFNALVNKGIFAILFDTSLDAFWKKHLGSDRLNRLQALLIPSRFVTAEEDIEDAHRDGKVVKVSWAGAKTHLINKSQGVAIPQADIVQGSDDRWNTLKMLYREGVKIIVQDFAEPARIPAYLRKRGITLEPVEWYNRICVKYVVEGNPGKDDNPSVAMTAVEVTLGPTIIPAGRECTFTAGTFA